MGATFFVAIATLFVCIIFLKTARTKPAQQNPKQTLPPYKYVRKTYIMTKTEASFYKRLQRAVNGKYIVFPQIHLSSLASNVTPGKYHKAGFQRINRRSVDYILADINTLQAVYAIELDDKTHDTQKGRAVDALKEEILKQIQIPLVRFRNVQNMTDEDIIAQLT